MQIAEAALASGLSADTIRFYDRARMLPRLPRDGRGWRLFPPFAVEWLTILAHLRKTGMPLDEVRAFAASAQGDDAESPDAQRARLALLERHRTRLAERRAELEACEAYLDMKISVYTTGLGL